MEPINKIYYSEKSTFLGLFLWFSLIGAAYAVLNSKNLTASIIIGITLVFVGIIWFGTRYLIDENQLIIKIGPVTYSTINIKTINRISKSSSIMASPANSFERIAIQYDKSNEILLSPKNKSKFLEVLLSINPSIEIIDK